MKTLPVLAFITALVSASPALAVSPQQAEAALSGIIADVQAGNPDFSKMTPPIAEAVRASPDTGQQLAALGPARALVPVKTTDPFTFIVTFESGVVMNWTISFDAAGRINGLDAVGKAR